MNEQLLKMNGLSMEILDALSYETRLEIPLKKNLHYFDKSSLIAELISMDISQVFGHNLRDNLIS